MGFSHDPGPLPFSTVRDAKWGARLESIGWVGIHGEHGLDLPYTVCRVIALMKIDHWQAKAAGLPMPAFYADGRKLVSVYLERMPDAERIARGIPAEKP